MSATTPLLQVQEVSKQFPGVLALNRVSMQVRAGEVLAVIGENGAGKSTLMKIMAGVQLPDSGQLLLNGEPVQLPNCRTAMAHGVVLIHQELNLADNLTVAANISLGREPQWPKTGPVRFIDHQAIHAEARRCLDLVGLDVDPQALVSSLPVGKQQLVEIAKALSINARILIMDEPTSSLSSGEAERLFEVVKELRSRGVSIVYISHRLGEVEELADHVTVLRDGANAGELDREEITHDRMVQMMVGRDVSQFYSREPHPVGDVVLETENLVTPAWPGERINIRISAGEIVGIAGVAGNGQREMAETVLGLQGVTSGHISIAGTDVKLTPTVKLLEKLVSYIPEDRLQDGFLPSASVGQNLILGLHRREPYSKNGFLNWPVINRAARKLIGEYKIRTLGPDDTGANLSGGNIQRVMIARAFSFPAKLMVAHNPTQGLDIPSIEFVFSKLLAHKEGGGATLLISENLDELLLLCDRIATLYRGQIAGILERDAFDKYEIGRLMSGARIDT
ncbi:MAG: ABC transporter ATP-binding protein [Caldilineaceae bacterium]|nr:ABC transporter ATP-binding protein [Caldilineaceae bacterium]